MGSIRADVVEPASGVGDRSDGWRRRHSGAVSPDGSCPDARDSSDRRHLGIVRAGSLHRRENPGREVVELPRRRARSLLAIPPSSRPACAASSEAIREEEAEFDRVPPRLCSRSRGFERDVVALSATEHCGIWSNRITRQSGVFSPVPRQRGRTAGDGFFANPSRPARGVRCAQRSSTRCTHLDSRSARGCTPERSRRSTTKWAAWR